MSELALQMEGVDKAYRFFSLRNIRLALERGRLVVASFKATGARLVPLRDA